MIINRVWARPNKHTFSIKPIKELVQRYVACDPLIIDPFANSCKIADITNDLDPQYDTNFNLEALQFLGTINDNSIDLILLDPPFSPTQVKRLYEELKLAVNRTSTNKAYWSMIKREAARILVPGGIAISCGWNSGGIGKKNGFNILEILMVPHGGGRNDTIVVVDRKEELKWRLK